MDAETSARDGRRFEWQVVLDETDYRAMAQAYAEQQRHSDKSRSKWLVALSWLVFCAVLVAVFSWVEPDSLTAAFLGFLGGALGVLLASAIYNRLAMPRTIEQLSGTKGVTIAIAMDDHGIKSTTSDSSVRFAWSSIKGVSESGTHYFMWPKALYALVLPKRLLRDANETARFAEALKDWTGGK